MLVVVSDTSPVRALAHLGHLELLRDLFERVLLPPAVVAELLYPAGSLTAVDVTRISFLEQRTPMRLERVQEFLKTLDPGEAEALALAEEVGAHLVLIDEAAGRAAALNSGLAVMGTLGLLVKGKERGKIPVVAPLILRLRKELGFFISADLQDWILRRVGE